MRLRKHRDARDSAVRREVVQMDVQQGRAGGFNGRKQAALHALEVVEALGAEEVHDQMGAGKNLAIAVDEVVMALVGCGKGTGAESDIRGGDLTGSRVVRDSRVLSDDRKCIRGHSDAPEHDGWVVLLSGVISRMRRVVRGT